MHFLLNPHSDSWITIIGIFDWEYRLLGNYYRYFIAIAIKIHSEHTKKELQIFFTNCKTKRRGCKSIAYANFRVREKLWICFLFFWEKKIFSLNPNTSPVNAKHSPILISAFHSPPQTLLCLMHFHLWYMYALLFLMRVFR